MEFELKVILRIFWRWAWLLVASTLLAAVISYSATREMPRIYSATTTLMVGQLLQATNPNEGDFATSQQLAQTYVQLVKRQPLLEATGKSLGLNVPWQALASQVNAATLPNTQLIQIAVVDTSPDRAKLIADEVAHQLILQSPTPVEKEQDQRQSFLDQQLADLQSHINESQDQIKSLQSQLATENSARGVQDIQAQIGALQTKIATWQGTYASLLTSKVGHTNNLSVVEPATGSPIPVSPNTQLNVLTAALVGFVLALGAVLLIEYLDDTLKTADDLRRAVKIPYLGSVGAGRSVRGAPLVTLVDPQSQAAEAYRVLRTSVQLAMRKEARLRLLVTSSGIGEGKTATAANLAVSLAQAGKTVVLCDLDLRRPSLHRLFNVSNNVGLSGLMLEPSLPAGAALVETAQPGLWLLPSGSLPANPGELLEFERLGELMDELAQHADVLVFDSSGVGSAADTRLLATFANAVVLVVDSRRTRREALRQSIATLEQADARILGVLLNRTRGAWFRKRHASHPTEPAGGAGGLRLPAILGMRAGLQR